MLRFQPVGQLFKGQHGVRKALIMLRLILFGNAGTDKDHLRIGHSFLDIFAVSLHGREHIGQIGQLRRKIFLNQQIDRMATGGNQNIPVSLPQKPLIFGLHDRGSDGSFLHLGKAQFFQCLAHSGNANAIVIGNKGRRQTDINRIFGLNHHPYLFRFVHNLFCILRTNHKALSAKNTFVPDDVRLVARKTDGFHRTMTNAFITVLTV